jgi:hypothetical protein
MTPRRTSQLLKLFIESSTIERWFQGANLPNNMSLEDEDEDVKDVRRGIYKLLVAFLEHSIPMLIPPPSVLDGRQPSSGAPSMQLSINSPEILKLLNYHLFVCALPGYFGIDETYSNLGLMIMETLQDMLDMREYIAPEEHGEIVDVEKEVVDGFMMKFLEIAVAKARWPSADQVEWRRGKSELCRSNSLLVNSDSQMKSIGSSLTEVILVTLS